jgi:hypothetical protein
MDPNRPVSIDRRAEVGLPRSIGIGRREPVTAAAARRHPEGMRSHIGGLMLCRCFLPAHALAGDLGTRMAVWFAVGGTAIYRRTLARRRGGVKPCVDSEPFCRWL